MQDKNRRSGPRTFVCLPVSVKTSSDEAARPVRIRDMSARGISLFSDFDLHPMSRFEVIVSVPYEISLTQAIHVRLAGQVMRIDELDEACPEDGRSIAATLLPISAVGHA